MQHVTEPRDEDKPYIRIWDEVGLDPIKEKLEFPWQARELDPYLKAVLADAIWSKHTDQEPIRQTHVCEYNDVTVGVGRFGHDKLTMVMIAPRRKLDKVYLALVDMIIDEFDTDMNEDRIIELFKMLEK